MSSRLIPSPPVKSKTRRKAVLWLSTVTAVLLPAISSAAVSVTAHGSGTLTFDSAPASADWATLSIAGASADIATAAALDTAVQALTASSITAGLTTDGTVPPAAFGTGRYNSTGDYLQTRPTGVRYHVIMARVRNDSGAALTSLHIAYSLGVHVAAGATIAEEVPGHRVFYSLTGAASSWTLIPSLSTGTAGALEATLNLGSWANAATLYVLWADDNAAADANGSGTEEGGYSIDNVAFSTISIPMVNNQSFTPWRYYKNSVITGQAPPPDTSGRPWYDPAYVETASDWESQSAAAIYSHPGGQLNGQGTQISPTPGSMPLTIYFRGSFNRTAALTPRATVIRAVRDDGIVVHINGEESVRQNMPPHATTYNTLASAAVDGVNESAVFSSPAQVVSLVNGVNSVAVEVHNISAGSSDIGFGIEIEERAGATPTLTRVPYLQMGNHNSMVVRWRTSVACRGWLRVRKDGVASATYLDEASTAITSEHDLLRIVNLEPETKYYYSVGFFDMSGTRVTLAGDAGLFPPDANAEEYSFITSPIPGHAKRTRVWVLGDSGDPAAGSGNVFRVRDQFKAFNNGSSRVDLWLMLGDNAYDNGTDAQYQAGVFDVFQEFLRKSPMWPTIGNHETGNPSSTGPTVFDEASLSLCAHANIFTLPTQGEAGGIASGTENYFSFDYANIHFVCLDSQISPRYSHYTTEPDSDSPMIAWLKQDLAQNDKPWLVAFWHHPPHSIASHNSDTEVRMVEMRENACHVLEDYGVDLVLCGHDHNYQRTRLIDGYYGLSAAYGTVGSSIYEIDHGLGQPGTDGITGAYIQSTTGQFGAHAGTVYVVLGNSSRDDSPNSTHPAMSTQTKFAGTAASGVLDVHGNRLIFRVIDENGITRDSFTLFKKFSIVELPAKDGPGANYDYSVSYAISEEGDTAGFLAGGPLSDSAAIGWKASATLNDTQAGITYSGSWTYSSARGFGDYQDDVHSTTANNDFASYTFTGGGVQFVTELAPEQGNIDVYIDNVFKQRMNAFSATRIPQFALYKIWGLAAGNHTIKVVKASGTAMLVDAFVVSLFPPTATDFDVLTAAGRNDGLFSEAWGMDGINAVGASYNGAFLAQLGVASSYKRLGDFSGAGGCSARAIRGNYVVGWAGGYRGALWQAPFVDGQVATDLGSFPGTSYSQAWGVNSSRQIVGWSHNGTYLRAFRTVSAAVQPSAANILASTADLGVIPGFSHVHSYASAINERGQTAGYSTPDAGAYARSFLLQPEASSITAAADLGYLGVGAKAQGLNNYGIVVGYIVNTVEQAGAFYYVGSPGTGGDGKMFDLNLLLPSGSVFTVLREARGVTAKGEIVGWGNTTLGPYPGTGFRGFVLKP